MELKTPSEWEEIFGIKVMDPDGWRGKHAPSWDTLLDVSEWYDRMAISTCKIVDRKKYSQAQLDYPEMC